jgi:hypothetical protein
LLFHIRKMRNKDLKGREVERENDA